MIKIFFKCDNPYCTHQYDYIESVAVYNFEDRKELHDVLDKTIDYINGSTFVKLFYGAYICAECFDYLNNNKKILQDSEFEECNNCKIKTGSPALCHECSTKRWFFSKRKKILEQVH